LGFGKLSFWEENIEKIFKDEIPKEPISICKLLFFDYIVKIIDFTKIKNNHFKFSL